MTTYAWVRPFRRIRPKRSRYIPTCCVVTLISGLLLFACLPVPPAQLQPSNEATSTNRSLATFQSQFYEDSSIENLPKFPLLSSEARLIVAEAASEPHTIVTNELATLTVVGSCDLELVSTISKLIGLPSSFHLEQIIIPCPLYQTKQAASFRHMGTLWNVHTLVQDIEDTPAEEFAFAHAASITNTSTILFLNANTTPSSLEYLLTRHKPTFPVGPRGLKISSTGTICIGSPSAQPVAFLVPPFLAPAHIVRRAINGMHAQNASFWLSLGHRISLVTSLGMGGVALSPTKMTELSHWCDNDQVDMAHDVDQPPFQAAYQSFHDRRSLSRGAVTLLLPTPIHLREFGEAACRLAQNIDGLRIVLRSADGLHRSPSQSRWLHTAGCGLQFDLLPQQKDVISSTMLHLNSQTEVFIVGVGETDTEYDFGTVILRLLQSRTITIGIPLADLPYSDWIGTLTIDELKHWYTPRIDIVVITNNRPWSLKRLLASLESALYFGDRPTLIINMEQTADPATRRISDGFTSKHGLKLIRHRIVLAGLMPAVVESWYPSSNDTYGLLLEDDIEVSPLFYAWAKMTLLRYRYGIDRSKSRTLFGISLYQQKVLELLPEGRKPFSAQAILSTRSPYLSQVPCSWGAIFFPEHWREFHDYLILRISETKRKISDVMVPDARSNKWTKSWKKFFIELIYLRGYVMLYPNYDAYVSLSTNHLEVGSHVKALPQEIMDRRKQDFTLPLMMLPSSSNNFSRLLDLPNDTLPNWDHLPVFDLFGTLSSTVAIKQRGVGRRRDVFHCSNWNASTFDANELFCH